MIMNNTLINLIINIILEEKFFQNEMKDSKIRFEKLKND